MRPSKDFVGLCLTCNNAETCGYRKRRGTDAIYCEMFDGYAPPEGNGSKDKEPVVMMAPEKMKTKEFKGLCVNCAHRDDCALSRSEGGIWHCEEYE